MNHSKTQKYLKLFQVTLVAAIVYLVLRYLLPLVIPFVIAYFICRMFYPWAEKISKKLHLPLVLCASILVGLFSILLIGALGLAVWYLVGQLQTFLVHMGDIQTWGQGFFDRLCVQLASFTGSEHSAVRDFLCDMGEKLMEWLPQKVPELMAKFTVPLIKGVGTLMIVMTIAFIGAILLMKNKKRIKYQLNQNIFAREITGLTGRICEVAASFLRCQAIIIAIIAVVLSIGLRLMGNHYGITIGVVVALLDALPVIGSGTVLIPWAVISLFTGNYIQTAVLVVLYALCTVIRELLEPRLLGDKLGVNEFYMLMATFIGVAIFGIWGIILGPLGMIMILEILKQMEDLYEGE